MKTKRQLRRYLLGYYKVIEECIFVTYQRPVESRILHGYGGVGVLVSGRIGGPVHPHPGVAQQRGGVQQLPSHVFRHVGPAEEHKQLIRSCVLTCGT